MTDVNPALTTISSGTQGFLGIKQIFRSSSKLSAVNILGGGLTALAGLLVARRLGPEGLGVVGLVQLWLLYAALSRPGFWGGGQREMLFLLGQNRLDEANRTKDVALTAEFPFVGIACAVMVWFGFVHYRDFEMRLAMILGAATFLTTSLYSFADGIQWAHQRFGLITRVGLIQQVLGTVFILIGLFTIGIFGVLAAPILSSLIAFCCYVFMADTSHYRPTWDLATAKRIFRAGFPLSIYTFLYWGFRTSDRAMVASWLTIKDLGYFTFAMMFINQGCQLISDFTNVFQANLFSGLGRIGSVKPIAFKLQRMSLLILLVTGLAAGLSQAGFHPAIAIFLPKFLPGVRIFEILALNLMAITALFLPSTVLISPTVNRQVWCVVVQCIGLAINVALGWLLVRRGYGLPGIAWSSVCSQLCVAFCFYVLLHDLIFEVSAWRKALVFYFWAAGLVLAPLFVYWVMNYMALFMYVQGHNWIMPAFCRLMFVAFFWSLISWATYRRWRPEIETA